MERWSPFGAAAAPGVCNNDGGLRGTAVRGNGGPQRLARETPSTGGIALRLNFKWTVGLLTLLASGALAGVFLPTSSAKTTTHHASKVTINVTANEWSFKLSKKTVPVGT